MHAVKMKLDVRCRLLSRAACDEDTPDTMLSPPENLLMRDAPGVSRWLEIALRKTCQKSATTLQGSQPMDELAARFGYSPPSAKISRQSSRTDSSR